MASPQLRSLVHRVGSRALLRASASSTQSVSPFASSALRSFSSTETAHLADLQASGFVDSNGHTNFDTLHELRISACAAYHDRDLFGTFAPGAVEGEGEYKWMTYSEFNVLVDKTRAVLQNLGT